MRRRVLGGAILALWVGMVGWQVRREYFAPDYARLAEAAMALAPGVNFYNLRMGERTVGQATSRLDTIPDERGGGFQLEDLMILDLPALGQTGSAVARTNVKLSPALVMESFEFTLDSEVGRFAARGRLDPDSTLRVTIDAGGGEQEVSYRLAEPPIFSAVLPIRIAMAGELEVGRTLRLPVFDPSTLSTRPVEIRVLAHDTLVVPDSAALDPASGRWTPARYDSIPVWRIAEVHGGTQVESWIDDDGRIVKASSPLGFTMEKTEYELARQAQEDARGLSTLAIDDDVILRTAIASNVDLGEVGEHDELRFRLSGVDLSGFQLDGGRQQLRGDTLIVRREPWQALDPGYSLPYKTMDLREELEPEPLIQSDDPRIIDAARQIVGRWTRDPRVAAARLERAVHQRLEKTVTFSVPSAVQVLETEQGDCNEHTVLYVALARALGLPARTAVGLVYLNGAFFYHAWPEVWLGEWVAVDPTFGQAPADAAHIRFVIGGLAQQVEIIRLIGRLDIEVLDG
ncbi:MAG: transglutaminase domain-containing protein [Gemmatimonadetes bacterium]|nr:MAG: transglutaminase domain-containing protein [Gemmatimonadota bacterium]